MSRHSCTTCGGGDDATRQSRAIMANTGKGYGMTRSSGMTGTACKGCDMSKHMIVKSEDCVNLELPIVMPDGRDRGPEPDDKEFVNIAP